LSLGDSELHALAAGLGSDVPFFLLESAARATGRGELVEPLIDAAGRAWRMPFPLVVAVPPVRVSTAEAYALVEARPAGRPDLRAAVLSNDPERWSREIVNDFQGPVADQFPPIQSALGLLAEAGATYRSLSGSGSSVFGTFDSDHAAGAAASVLSDAGCVTFVQQAR
jgi:4-diphosphocytidyl-2-C-methyl-D-erythritol kinase